VAVGDESFVMADVPGLIEGAHQGRGLGIRFLRHLERTRYLLVLIECTSEDPGAEHRALRAELAAHSADLARLPHRVVLTKRDLRPDFRPPPAATFPGAEGVDAVSSVTGSGIQPLLHATLHGLRRSRSAEASPARMSPP
jgi:GTP-binding protein